MKRILDPEFRYVPAASTDISATFRRVRREQKEQAKAEAAAKAEAVSKVKVLRGSKP